MVFSMFSNSVSMLSVYAVNTDMPNVFVCSLGSLVVWACRVINAGGMAVIGCAKRAREEDNAGVARARDVH